MRGPRGPGAATRCGARRLEIPPRRWQNATAGRREPEASDWRGSHLAFPFQETRLVGTVEPPHRRIRGQDLSEGLCLVAVVLHEHSADVSAPIEEYEKRLAPAGLSDVPFHGKDLLHGNEGYRAVSPGDRKRLLIQFARLVRSLPFSYVVLRYSASDTHDRRELESRIRRDFSSLVRDRLGFFQGFDTISVYYDDGQWAVSGALHDALDFVLTRNVADYRDADHGARRLLQVAGCICAVERASIAYDRGSQSRTHERFFGSRRSFMLSDMKQLARKRAP